MFRPNPNPAKIFNRRRRKTVGEMIQRYIDRDEEIPLHEIGRVLETEYEFLELGGVE